jgi:hypothetical protein
MRVLHLLILLLGAGIFMASTCRPLTTKDLDKLTPRIEMEKGPCYGSCPVYTLTIYEGGVAAYNGQRFTTRQGLHTKLLEANAYRELIKTFQSANLWSYQNAYKAQIPDLATITITYYEGDQSKSIKGKDGRPVKIEELEKLLTAIADSGGWERQAAGENYGMPPNIIANELIVNLSAEADPNVWIIQFAKQDLQIVKRLSPNSPYWLFRFNADRIGPNEMLEWVRRDPYVLSAEFNQQINGTPRND